MYKLCKIQKQSQLAKSTKTTELLLTVATIPFLNQIVKSCLKITMTVSSKFAIRILKNYNANVKHLLCFYGLEHQAFKKKCTVSKKECRNKKKKKSSTLII